MEQDSRQKRTTVSILLTDIDNSLIEQLYLPGDVSQKRSLIKKILDLPDNFNGVIGSQLNSEKLTLYWDHLKQNSKAEDLHRQAILIARKGELKSAIEYWLQATRINPQEPDYFFNLGVANFELKKYMESIDFLTRTLAICPVYYKAHLILGTAYLKIRKFENSKKHIEKSLLFDKNNLLAYLNLGSVHSILKDYKNGIIMFEKAIALAPKEATSYMGLAKIYSTLENTEKANFYFKKVIDYDQKGNLANYAKRSIISQDKKRIDSEDIDINSANPEEYYAEAYRNYIIGNFMKAIQIYKKYLSLKGNDDYVWYALGEAQLRAGQAELAAESFKKAAKLAPSKGLYYKELAIAFDKLEKYDKVIAAMSKAKELGKNDSIILCLWGKALFELGKVEESIERFEESLKLNKNNLLTKYYFAVALAKNNETNDASNYIDEIIHSQINTPLKEKCEKLKKQFQS